jgi:hypothetical protein
MDAATLSVKRIGLSNDQWAKVRRTTLLDMAFLSEREDERGKPLSEAQMLIFLLPKVITEWSFGDINEDAIGALPEMDASLIYGYAKLGIDDPKVLRALQSLAAGTDPAEIIEALRISNGESPSSATPSRARRRKQ